MAASGVSLFIIAIAGLIALFIGCISYLYFGRLWFRAYVKGCPIPMGKIVAMTLRGRSSDRIVNAFVEAHVAGIEVSLEALEEHDRARGQVREVVRDMVRAREAGAELSFQESCSRDLQGKRFSEEMNRSN